MAEFNLDELVPPSFMTEAYIVDILRQVEDDPDLHVIPSDFKNIRHVSIIECCSRSSTMKSNRVLRQVTTMPASCSR